MIPLNATRLWKHSSILVVLVLLTVSSITCGQQSKITSSPKSNPVKVAKPAGPNPFYSEWASFKVGTEADYQLSITKDGIVTNLPLYYVLKETNPDKVVLELNMPAGRRVTIPANMDTAKDDNSDNLEADPKIVGALGWPALLYQFAYPPSVKVFSGHEDVVIEGKKFDCRYGSNTVIGMKITQWFSADVAGGLVKAKVVSDEYGTMDLVLSRITARQ